MPMPDFQDPSFKDNFYSLLNWRRDVRSFQSTPVDESLLHELLTVACLAPSVGLSQPWRFVKVESSHLRKEVYANFENANQKALSDYEGERAALYASLKLSGLEEAPIHLAVFSDQHPVKGAGLGRSSMPETVDYSVVTAIHTLWLAAQIHGLGVGWVSILDAEKLSKSLCIPEGWRFIAYLCVGYPVEQSDIPELERRGWENRQTLEKVLFTR